MPIVKVRCGGIGEFKCKRILARNGNNFFRNPTAQHGFQSYCKQCAHNHKVASHRTDPNPRRNSHIKRTYGLSASDVKALVKSQKGLCKICGKKETKTWRGARLPLSIEHCHRTGMVRGLTCHRCNMHVAHLEKFVVDKRLRDSIAKYLGIMVRVEHGRGPSRKASCRPRARCPKKNVP